MNPVREELARVAGEAAFEAISVLDGTTIVWCNRACEELFGVPREGILGGSPLRFAPEEEHARILEAIARGRSEPYEVTCLRADGTRFTAEVRGREVTVGDRPLRVATLRDLTPRIEAERELARSEARYRHLFEAAADGMMVMSLAGRPLEVNEALCKMLGREREEILRMDPAEGVADLEARPMQLHRLEREPTYTVERQLLHRDGSLVDVEVHVTALGPGEALAIIRDVRERRRGERERARLHHRLQQAQSLEAIGRLAGGVAHDFNNLLTVILGAARDLAGQADSRALAEDILEAGERAAELTSNLLTLDPQRPTERGRLDARDHLQRLAPLLRRLLEPSGHTLRLHLEAPPLPVLADAGQLTQIVMNLVLNARDATPEGGTIELGLEARECDGRPGLALEVRDSGSGIPEAVRARLFEPFFTTKGQGRGLGLSTVYGIARGYGGEVEVESSADGSLFRVLLPLAPEAPRSTREPEAAAPGRLRILLVEDEDAVRRVVRRILVRAGHEVLEASGATEAVRIAAREPYDLLLTDVVMPDGDGVALAMRLDPPRVLLMSGYPEAHLGKREDLRLVAKPFAPEELLRAVAEVAAAPARG